MTMRTNVLVLGATLALAGPVACSDLFAQGINIDHSAVGCVVAGQYPRLSACFDPGRDVARARIYFRADGAPYWYYVEMKPASKALTPVSGAPAGAAASTTPAAASTPAMPGSASCYEGILPRPKATIKKLDYYLHVVSKTYVEGRSEEHDPDVVPPGGCRKDVPVAPFLGKASVVVGAAAGAPAVPVGFAAAGIVGAGSSAGIIAIGAAGAGAAVAGVVATTGGSSGGGSTTPPTSPTVTTPAPSPSPSPIPSPSPSPAVGNKPPNASFVVDPDPPIGVGPLTVRFDMCLSSDPEGDPLVYTFDFGDGKKDAGACRTSHTYAVPGAFGATENHHATICVSDSHNPAVCRSYDVGVGCPQPRVKITSPSSGAKLNACRVGIEANLIDGVTVSSVDFSVATPSGAMSLGSDTDAPYTASLPITQFSGTYTVTASATNRCNNTGSDSVTFSVMCGSLGSGPPGGFHSMVWTSSLDMLGGRGQTWLNGRSALPTAAGPQGAMTEVQVGDNRLEGQLIEGGGRPGLWRFDFSGSAGLEPGSLQVEQGEIAELTATAVVFRMSGRPGERVVFTFRAR
jgi:hypothetical protein